MNVNQFLARSLRIHLNVNLFSARPLPLHLYVNLFLARPLHQHLYVNLFSARPLHLHLHANLFSARPLCLHLYVNLFSTRPLRQHLFIKLFSARLGHYVYIETSLPRKPNDTARLLSQSVPLANNGKCLKFWYHMYGSDIYKLNIYAKLGMWSCGSNSSISASLWKN
ncbi:hypothetical protein DPMN_055480 [Dreissena polymorpha]|uniref:MAM domain-containing protein n=1 Tax=Dreissena polymorpha TaxID=45954 RepID=A0A9D4HU46_DREPO|nr:hypothetical protein DPMN_055480 [Dreissena polymorpha]